MLTVLSLVVLAAPHSSVELRASVDGGVATPGWVYAVEGAKVELVAAVNAPAGVEPSEVHWFKLEPTKDALDNTTPQFHFEPVPYQRTSLARCDGALRCVVDVAPTLLPERLPGLGTMAFQVEVTLAGGDVVKSPGLESVKYGGLTRDVMRVTFRRDNSLLGYATELANVPYIFGSAGADGRNQTDLLIGADCADLVVYARRRSGRRATYTNSYHLDEQAPPLAAKAPVQAGDVVHFTQGRHVGFLWQDNAPLGVLDESDLIFHTCWELPRIQPLRDVTCAKPPWRVLRFSP